MSDVITTIVSGPNYKSPKASISVYVLAAGSQDGICVNEHQNTRPDSSLEKLWHELEKRLENCGYPENEILVIIIRTGSQMENVHGERANFTRLVLGRIEADFRK